MREKIFTEISAERERQDAKYPDCISLPDGTGGGGRKTWESIARHACDRAHREGRLTHAHIFDEEASEVLAETDPAKLRAELVQVAAVAVKWLEDIDRRAARLLPRGAWNCECHYNNHELRTSCRNCGKSRP